VLNDWVTFFLALLLVPVLLIEETSADPSAVQLATAANAFIWLAFALDYAVDLWRSSDRATYVRTHWFDLALIVVSPPLLVPPEAQALRVLRALRLLRAIAVIGVVAERLDRPLTRRAALAILAVLGVVLLAGGVLISAAEPGAIPTVAQGYVWTIATLVTAGHATPAPTTAVGQAISNTIVVMGLGTFAALAASLMSARAAIAPSGPTRVRVIVPSRGRILMVQHRAFDGLFWILPGGGVKPGETLEEAALREVWEEAGARCRIVRRLVLPDGVTGMGGYALFLGAVDTEELAPSQNVNGEVVHEVAWQPIDDTAPIGPLTPDLWSPIAPLFREILSSEGR
jgi:8-oxo-dGTP pyrophosphatase MutT (NUDIX family)